MRGYGNSESVATFDNRDGTPYRQTRRDQLAVDRVRYVGEPVACVAAETGALAKDAAEAIGLDIDALPAVVDMAAAPSRRTRRSFTTTCRAILCSISSTATPRGRRRRSRRPRNVARLSLEDSRVIINPMELRSCLAVYDAAREHLTLHTPCQGVFGLRNEIAGIMGLERPGLTVLTGHVGGSVGMRMLAFPSRSTRCTRRGSSGGR